VIEKNNIKHILFSLFCVALKSSPLSSEYSLFLFVQNPRQLSVTIQNNNDFPVEFRIQTKIPQEFNVSPPRGELSPKQKIDVYGLVFFVLLFFSFY
jgi:hypothetical protein